MTSGLILLLVVCAATSSLVGSFPSPSKTLSKASVSIRENTDGHNASSTSTPLPTCVILKVSYDGGRFTGWSGANDNDNGNGKKDSKETINVEPIQQKTRRIRRKVFKENLPKGFVRSVEGVLKLALSKLFAHIEPSRVVLEASSRTDKGVHADAAVVQAYVLSEHHFESLPITGHTQPPMPGKLKAHPTSAFDDSGLFESFRKEPGELMYVLNRMLPHDVRIRGVALMPEQTSGTHRPFHITLDAVSKTYEYHLSIGPFRDPTTWRKCWHASTAATDKFDFDAVQRALCVLKGQHNFAAFRGAPRGKHDKIRQRRETTICNMQDLRFEARTGGLKPNDCESFVVTVTGDRFLYKMVRFMVGSLVAIGLGRLSVDDLKDAIRNGTWESDGKRPQFECAPPHGLRLKHVEYDTMLDWIVD